MSLCFPVGLTRKYIVCIRKHFLRTALIVATITDTTYVHCWENEASRCFLTLFAA